ncbi:MAG: DNA polymerase I [Patescibacteria group bacterium]
MKKKKFIIIDANSLIHRAFHALPPLTARNGEVVNAVYGFANIFLKALKDFKPNYIACCFDVDKDTFRKKEYSEYKAHRKEQPSELYHQFPLIKQLLEAFRVPVYEKKGFEADDVIGTISKIVNKKHKEVKNIIVTGDMDMLQLVDNNTEVYTLKRGISDTIIYTSDAVHEKFGFGPSQVVDYKALRGDPSDNIPGVMGIGEKTATQLIQESKTLENLYKFIDSIKDSKEDIEKLKNKRIKEGVYIKLKEHKKEAFLSQWLATIKRDVETDFELKDAEVEPFNTEEVIDLFQNWKFNSLISKIPQAEKIMHEKQGTLFGPDIQPQQQDFEMKEGYVLVNSKEEVKDFVNKLKEKEEFVFDTETDGLDTFNSKLLGISFSWEPGKAYYVTRKYLNENIKKIFEDKKVKKIAHNLKFDYEVMKSFGFDVQGIYFDTMIASYLLNPGTRQHSLDALAFTELGYRMQPITDLIGEKKSKQINLSEVAVDKVANYSCEDADITWQLYEKLSEKLDDAIIDGILSKIEMPLIKVLAEMEKNGVKIDLKFLDKMSKDLGKRIKNLEKEIYSIAGQEFNVASPKQLKEILFEKMQISTAGLSRTKTGISTAAGELDKLKGKHKIVDSILEFREFSKLKNTYIDPLPKLVDKEDRVHTSFNQTITATGRLSSSNPNLQNIPIRTELGREIRKAFIAKKGYSILAVDYSQIELRIIASLANDKKMIRAFEKKADIHTQTGAEIFGIPPEKVTKEIRRQAKTVNFGVIYGLGAKGLAQGTGITLDEARDFIEKYFEVYDGVKIYIEETIELTRELGYTETLLGRRRYLPEINAHHPQLRSQAERMAVNMPVQGFAADLMKLAMINLHKRLEKEFAPDQVRMLLQVHDELVFEVKEDLTKHASKIIQYEMENVYKLRAPIEVEIGVGKNWGEVK